MNTITTLGLALAATSCSLLERTRSTGQDPTSAALEVLGLIETGRFDDAGVVLDEYRGNPTHSTDVASVLDAWLRRQHLRELTVSGALHAEPIAALKREGMQLYSEERVAEAIARWRQALELDPTDKETKQLLERAKTALRKKHEPNR